MKKQSKADTGHTPGPWKVCDAQSQMVLGHPPEGWKPTPENPRYIVVQTGLYVNTPREQHVPNAHLISAAPEMLEALKRAEAEITDPNRGPSGPLGTLAIIRAAIAKA